MERINESNRPQRINWAPGKFEYSEWNKTAGGYWGAMGNSIPPGRAVQRIYLHPESERGDITFFARYLRSFIIPREKSPDRLNLALSDLIRIAKKEYAGWKIDEQQVFEEEIPHALADKTDSGYFSFVRVNHWPKESGAAIEFGIFFSYIPVGKRTREDLLEMVEKAGKHKSVGDDRLIEMLLKYPPGALIDGWWIQNPEDLYFPYLRVRGTEWDTNFTRVAR